MSFYVNVHRLIWNDDKFPFVTDDCQLVFFHLLTTPMGTQFGLFKAGIAGLAEDKRWGIERYRKAMNEAIKNGFVEYDQKSLLVRIPHFLDYNRPNNPNVLKSWGRVFNGLPSGELKFQHYQQLKDFAEGLPKAFSKAFKEAFKEITSEAPVKALPEALPEAFDDDGNPIKSRQVKAFREGVAKPSPKDPEYNSDSDSDSDSTSESTSDQKQGDKKHPTGNRAERASLTPGAEPGDDKKKKKKKKKKKPSELRFVVEGKPVEPPEGFNNRQLEMWNALRVATFYIPGHGEMTAWQAVEDPIRLAAQLGGDAYPNVDVALIHRLGNWTMENRVKSKKKVAVFLTNRFSASQERGRIAPQNNKQTETKPSAVDLEDRVARMNNGG